MDGWVGDGRVGGWEGGWVDDNRLTQGFSEDRSTPLGSCYVKAREVTRPSLKLWWATRTSPRQRQHALFAPRTEVTFCTSPLP